MRELVLVFFFAASPLAVLAQDQSAQPPPANPAATPAQAPAAAAKAMRVRMGGDTMQSQVIKKVLPHYPGTAIDAHISGTVTLRVIVGTDGKVEDAQPVSGPPMFLQPATEAVRKWQYKPVLLNGSAVEVETSVAMVFTLNNNGARVEIYAPPSDASAQASGSPPASSYPPSSDAPPASAPAANSAILKDPHGEQHTVRQAKIIKLVKPKYPKAAKKAGISGTVTLHAVIGIDGHVDELSYVSGPEELEQSALDAVKKWVYEPTIFDGKPVAVDTLITVVFTLGD